MKRATFFKLAAIIAVATAIVVGCQNRQTKSEPISATLRQQILDELAPVDVWIGSLTPDAAGSTLAYINGTERGRRLTLVNLQTLERREVPTTNEVTFVFGWSPDDRYLAFAQIPPQPAKMRQRTAQILESWLTLYDRQSDSFSRLTSTTNVMEVPFHWLPNGAFLMGCRGVTNAKGEFFLGGLQTTNLEKVCDFVPDFAVMTEHLGVYAVGELLTVELKPLRKMESGWDEKSKTVRQISDLKTNGFNGLVWVRYSPVSSNLLFCARPAGSNWRYLYQFEPATRRLTQLSREDTYNGQWLQDGRGFAYVVNTNNSFQLAVRPTETGGVTNLFANGNVVVYKASPRGDKLFISASMGSEPHGIWEYTVTNQTLRKITEGTPKPFAYSTIVQPEEFGLKSFDGVETPCFLFAPVQLTNQAPLPQGASSSTARTRIKHPAVIYVPPMSSQFQRKFDHQAQLFANYGFYFAAINYRGCDGYGAEYSKLANPTNAARDVLNLYEKLIADPEVDKENIFLSTSSLGMQIVTEMLATHPKLWAGVAVDKPAESPIDERFIPRKLPPMLMIIGDRDPGFDSMNRFSAWAHTNAVEFKSVIHTNADHITYDVNDRKDTLRQVAEFFLAHRK